MLEDGRYAAMNLRKHVGCCRGRFCLGFVHLLPAHLRFAAITPKSVYLSARTNVPGIGAGRVGGRGRPRNFPKAVINFSSYGRYRSHMRKHFFRVFFIAVCYIEHIHTHARTCAQIPRPRYQVENGRARPPRTSINSENRRTNKYTCPAFGVISAIRPIEQSTTIGSENISIPCIPFVIPSGDSDSSVPATSSTMWTALCLIATALVGTSYQRAPVSDPSSLLGRVGETIRLTRLTFIGSYRVPGYGHDQLGRRRRKSRRSQPVRVRRLRQLVAEHHRNHQQHRGARRERAADHTDRPELVRPVQ